MRGSAGCMKKKEKILNCISCTKKYKKWLLSLVILSKSRCKPNFSSNCSNCKINPQYHLLHLSHHSMAEVAVLEKCINLHSSTLHKPWISKKYSLSKTWMWIGPACHTINSNRTVTWHLILLIQDIRIHLLVRWKGNLTLTWLNMQDVKI